jgi:hypothetical protein
MAASRLVELGQQGFRRRGSGRCSHGTFFQVSHSGIYLGEVPLKLELDFKTKYALQHPLQQHEQKQKILRQSRVCYPRRTTGQPRT